MKKAIIGYLRDLKKKTVIMATHAVRFAPIADKIVIMKKGRIIKSGTYE
jgi:ABC-type transport system involved in cytochrome bd biosynthesis fused ATPase/permease subunit